MTTNIEGKNVEFIIDDIVSCFDDNVSYHRGKLRTIINNQLQKARDDIKRDINYIHYNLRNAIRNERDGLNVKGYEGEVDKWLSELAKATHSKQDQDKK